MNNSASECLGFSIWTKNSPKSYIYEFADFAKEQRLPIVAVVDDMLPEVVFGRTDLETKEMNNQYVQYMHDAGFDDISFASELIPDRDEDLFRIYHMSGRIAVSSFIGLLPEHKRLQSEDLRLNEVIDPCWQMHVLETGIVTCGITKYLTVYISTAFFRLAKSVIPDFDFETID